MRWLLVVLLLMIFNGAEAQLWRKLHPDSLLQMDLRFLPAPILFRSPETSWGFGVSTSYYFNTASNEERAKTRSSNIQFQAVRTMRQQTIAQLITDVFTPNEKYYLRTYVGYRDYLDRFYGIGAATSEDQGEEYRFKSWVTATELLYKFNASNFIGINIRSQVMYQFRPDSIGVLADGRIPGSLGSKMFGFGPEWLLDTRDNPFAPVSGYYLNLSGRYHPKWDQDWFDFGIIRTDARIYRQIGRENVWASKLEYQQILGSAPFREMAMMGGSKGMRGYFLGRYREQSLFELHTEYRFAIWKMVRGAVFTGIGQLGEHPGDYFKSYWKGNYGAGLRLLANKKERITVRLDYGRTLTGQSGFYIEFNEAF